MTAGTRRRRWALLAAMAAMAATTLGAGGADAASAAQAKLVYASFSEGSLEISTVRADGRGERRLTRTLESEADPAWSPNRRRIVFMREGRLFVMRANGTRVRRIRNTRFAGSPAWSPDGKRIAYAALVGDARDTSIYTIRPNGKGRRRLGVGSEPDWSPSGKSIAYQRGADVWKMRANGRRKRKLFENGSSPSWSPNARRIAFVRYLQVFVARPNGSGARNLTGGLARDCESEEDCEREDTAPAWSPSGKRIAYAQTYLGGDNGGIHTIRPNGTGDRQLTTGGELPDW